MMPDAALLVPALGMGVAGAGVLAGIFHRPDFQDRSGDLAEPPLSTGSGHVTNSAADTRSRRLLAVVSSMAVGLAVAATTRWFVAAAAAAAATAWLPSLLQATAGGRRIERMEAIATWTELLRDTLSAAAGLGQAIMTTAELAPRPIRQPVAVLAARLSNGVAMDDALRAFAAELDEPSGDLVVCALLLASSTQSQRLVELLSALAVSCREEVAMDLRVEASRASARSSVRTVVLFSLAFGALLFVVAHSYLAPFGTVTGQLVLLVVCACYAAGLWLMVRLVRPRPSHRLLRGIDRG